MVFHTDFSCNDLERSNWKRPFQHFGNGRGSLPPVSVECCSTDRIHKTV